MSYDRSRLLLMRSSGVENARPRVLDDLSSFVKSKDLDNRILDIQAQLEKAVNGLQSKVAHLSGLLQSMVPSQAMDLGIPAEKLALQCVAARTLQCFWRYRKSRNIKQSAVLSCAASPCDQHSGSESLSLDHPADNVESQQQPQLAQQQQQQQIPDESGLVRCQQLVERVEMLDDMSAEVIFDA